MSGSIPSRTSTALPTPHQADRTVCPGQDRCSRLPAGTADLRARHIGNVLINTAVDRPWSQYFCCMMAGSREYVQSHPVATKRVLRAIIKAADFCATEPARAAQPLVDGGLYPPLRRCPADVERAALRQMAGVRRRGHDPVRCACAKRA